MTIAEFSGFLSELKEKGVQAVAVSEVSKKGLTPCKLEAFSKYKRGDEEPFVALNVLRLREPNELLDLDNVIDVVEESTKDYALNENVKVMIEDSEPALLMEYEIIKTLCILQITTVKSLSETSEARAMAAWLKDGSPMLSFMQFAKTQERNNEEVQN